MIPPNASLVKYDNPVLVSRNTDKKTPRVSDDEIDAHVWISKTVVFVYKNPKYHEEFGNHDVYLIVDKLRTSGKIYYAILETWGTKLGNTSILRVYIVLILWVSMMNFNTGAQKINPVYDCDKNNSEIFPPLTMLF